MKSEFIFFLLSLEILISFMSWKPSTREISLWLLVVIRLAGKQHLKKKSIAFIEPHPQRSWGWNDHLIQNKELTNRFAPSTFQKHLQPSNIRELEKALVWPNILQLFFFKISQPKMSTSDGQNGYIFSKPQPIHPTHDTTYIQVLAPPESAGPIALFPYSSDPRTCRNPARNSRRINPPTKGKIWGIHPVILF